VSEREGRPDRAVGEVGAVEGDDERSRPERQGYPAAQAVVGVDDVEAPAAVARP
jgi:hypothetical protein